MGSLEEDWVLGSGCEHGGHAAAGRRAGTFIIRAEEYLLLLDGITVQAGGADLGEEGSIRTLLCILRTLHFHIGHFHGSILGKGYLEGVVQGEHQRAVIYRTFLPRKLRPCSRRNQQRKRHKYVFKIHITN